MFTLRASCSFTRPALAAGRSSLIRRPMSSNPSSPSAFDYMEAEHPTESEPEPFNFDDGTDGPPKAGGSSAFARTLKSPLLPSPDKPCYRLHCYSSRNNTITTLTKPNGNPVAWASGGSCGFKKANRAGYEAGYKCAVAMFAAIQKEQKEQKVAMSLELFFKGFGEGRDAMKAALLGAEGAEIRDLVTRVTDRTPIKIGGTRSKKTRRV